MTISRTAAFGGAVAFATMVTGIAYSNFDISTATALAQQATAAAQGKVTKTFENAPAQQVLDWLKGTGINFVIETSNIPKDKRLTVNLRNASQDDALKAIARALGLGLSKSGDVYTLGGQGFAGFWSDETPMPQVWSVPQPGEAPKAFAFPKEFMKDFKWDEKAMEQAQEEIAKAMKEHGAAMRSFKLDEKEMARVHEEMERSMKEHGDLFKEGGAVRAYRMDEKEMAKVREQIEKSMKAHGEAMKSFKLDEKEMARVHEDIAKAMKEHEGAMRVHVGPLKEGGAAIAGTGRFRINIESFEEILASLSPAQKEKHEKQGHLKISDLTDAQRKILGIEKGAKVSLAFEKDGRKLVIKPD